MSISIQGAKLIPIFIFICIWILEILLYVFSPYPYKIITFDTWILIFTSVLTVTIGYFAYYFFNTSRSVQTFVTPSKEANLLFRRNNLDKILRILIILVTLGIIGEIIYLAYTIKTYGLNVTNIYWYRFFFTSTVKQRFGWDILHSIFSYLILLNNIAAILSGIYFCYFSIRKIRVYIPIFLALIFSIITLQRYTLISNLTFWLGSIFFMSFYLNVEMREKTLSKLRNVLVVMILFFFSIIMFVITIRINITLGGTTFDKLIEFGFKSVYSYLAGNIVALDQYLNKDIIFKEGAFFFRDILKWLSRFGLVESQIVPPKYMEFTNVGPIAMNTYSFIRILYDDFGIFGLLPLCYVWGFVGSFIIQNFYERFTLYKLMFVNLILYSFLISFFTFSLHNITMLILLFLLSWFIEFFMKIGYKKNHENSAYLV